MTLPLLLVTLVCQAPDAGVSAADSKRAEQMVREMDAKKASPADIQSDADTKAVLAGTATPQQVARVRARAAAAEAAKQNAAAKQKAEDEEVVQQRNMVLPGAGQLKDGG